MPALPPINVHHPHAHDIVNDPVGIAGIGSGFEGVLSAQIRDGNGTTIVDTSIHAGGTGIWGNFQLTMPVGVPATSHGTLEVFESSAKGDGTEINKVVVPLVFGSVLTAPDEYHGFAQYTVVPGDTLAHIAHVRYNDATKWPRIFAANRHQLNDPNLIVVGQVLRVPE